jgi:hypothetical protein
VHENFAGALFLPAKLVPVKVHQTQVLRLHEALGNKSRSAERDVFTHFDSDVAAVAIHIRAVPKAPSYFADLRLKSVGFG